MFVELGNPTPKDKDGQVIDLGAPTVTRISIPEEYEVTEGFDVAAFKAHLGDRILLSDHGITNFGGDRALLAVVHPGGSWRAHSAATTPTWVWSDNKELERQVSEFFGGISRGRPADVELTHFTRFGPPGVGEPLVPEAVADVKDIVDLLVNTGRDQWAKMEAGGSVGSSGTATATSSTSLTNSGASWTTNQWAGYRVYAGTVWGIVQSNSGTVLTIDRWYNPATPGGTAGSTPSGTSTYVISDGAPPAWFVAISANNTSPSATDTSLTGEITTAGGGLVRQIAPFAHTAGTNTYTLTPVYTANGSDSLPVTIAKVATFSSMVVSSTIAMFFEDLLSSTATLTASGDTLTITITVTGS